MTSMWADKLNAALPQHLRVPYVWVLPPHALGDSYLTLSLAQPFMLSHPDTPLTIVLPAEHARVMSLFPYLIERSCVITNLTLEMCRLLSKGEQIAPGVPFVTHPEYLEGALSMRLIGINGFRHWDAWKLMLGLDQETPIPWHVVTAEQRIAAQHRFASLGLSDGRTAVLFPKSNAIDSSEIDWAGIAMQLSARGWSLCCNLRPGEPLIPGAIPVDIPLDELCPFIELAGWAIASRSGICDIFAAADCRKTILYPAPRYLEMFSFSGVAERCEEWVGNTFDMFADERVR